MYASKEQLHARVQRGRTVKDVEIPGFGLVKLQTITAREFVRIDAARNRAIMAASSGRMKEQIEALNDQFMELVKATFVEPVFTESDRELLLSLDSALADAIKEACYAHCELDDARVDEEDAKKN